MYKLVCSIFCANLVSFSAWGSEHKLKQFNPIKKKVEVVVAVDYKGVQISKDCVSSKTSTCKALAAIKKRETLKVEPVSGLLGHPAARYCQSLGAINLIFLTEKQVEQDYCLFSDKSFVSSWGLFNAVH